MTTVPLKGPLKDRLTRLMVQGYHGDLNELEVDVFSLQVATEAVRKLIDSDLQGEGPLADVAGALRTVLGTAELLLGPLEEELRFARIHNER